MTRVVPHNETGPMRLPLADIKADLYLCRCGLSANGAFCDGSHKRTRDEAPGTMYVYERRPDGELVRTTLAPPAAPSVPAAHAAAPAVPAVATAGPTPSPLTTAPAGGA